MPLLAIPIAAGAQSVATPGHNAATAMHTPPTQAPELVEQRIATLYSKLSITPAQEAAWAGFTTVMRANANQLDAAWATYQARLPTMDAVANLREYAAIEQERVTELEHLATPFAALYASFSPEQRLVADRIFRDIRKVRRPATH